MPAVCRRIKVARQIIYLKFGVKQSLSTQSRTTLTLLNRVLSPLSFSRKLPEHVQPLSRWWPTQAEAELRCKHGRVEEDESKTQKLTTPELIQQMVSVTNSYPLIMYGRPVKQSISLLSSPQVTLLNVKLSMFSVRGGNSLTWHQPCNNETAL